MSILITRLISQFCFQNKIGHICYLSNTPDAYLVKNPTPFLPLPQMQFIISSVVCAVVLSSAQDNPSFFHMNHLFSFHLTVSLLWLFFFLTIISEESAFIVCTSNFLIFLNLASLLLLFYFFSFSFFLFLILLLFLFSLLLFLFYFFSFSFFLSPTKTYWRV